MNGLLATARRIASGQWTVGPEGAAEMESNEDLAELVRRGYARLHFISAERQVAGSDDHWTLTEDGKRWFAAITET